MLTCNKCKYWHAEPLADFGECRRYPPESINNDNFFWRMFPSTNNGMFPSTNNDDWCGEFHVKESCALCSGELPSEYLYNPKLASAFTQSLEGRICRNCFESMKAV